MAKRNVHNYKSPGSFNYYVPGVSDLFILVVWLLVGVLIGNIVNLAFVAILGPEAGAEYGMLVAYPLMFIPAMIYASAKSRSNMMFKDGVKLDSSNFGKFGFALCALVVVLSTLALGFCTDALSALMPKMPEWLETVLKSMTNGTVWINLLCVSVFAPLFEEWLCRGQVLRGLLSRTNIKPGWAVVISALFFAVIHANPWQALPAFSLGLLFGYVYYRTGSLKLTMLMHCTNNTFAVILGNIDGLSDMESWHEVLTGTRYWVIFAACFILVVLAVLFFKKIPVEKKGGNLDIVPKIFDEVC